jgi:ribosomal protein S18 acetylase RimI-like enzyme
MLQLRPAKPTDAQDLAQLVTDLGYPVNAADLWARIEKMPSSTYRTIVALVDEKVAGFIGLLTLPVYEHDHPIGWILALCVDPQHRRLGVGTALIQEAEKYYRTQGVSDMRLHSGIQRNEAHEFYEKLGFDKSGYRFKKRL